jgi:hypothetical protein
MKIIRNILIALIVLVGAFYAFNQYIYNEKQTDNLDVNSQLPTESNDEKPQIANLIVVDQPLAGATITSPVIIKGQARGPWFFEASFPIYVVDWDGLIIGEGYATAESDWMTTDFVPFTATVEFDITKISGNYSKRGILILKKDNPSGLPEHDRALEYDVVLGE